MAQIIDMAAEQARFTGMFRESSITIFGADQHGLCAVQVSFPQSPVDIVVKPRTYGGEYQHATGSVDLSFTAEQANDAAQIAARVADYDYDCARLRAAIEDKRAAVAERDAARRKLERVLEPRNPQPQDDMLLRGGKSSEVPVWLHGWQDKDRGGSAFGYHFPNPAAFWQAHPELRPIEWGQDEHGPWMRLRRVPVVKEASNG